FKRFTVYIIDFFKEKFVWAKKKSVAVSADAEHDKRIAENYVFDEVLGIYVPRTEHEKRVRFNSDTYSPTQDEIRLFPNRPKNEKPKIDRQMELTSTIPSRKDNLLKLKPPGYKDR
ncbi:MobQ family relaxase, partial [Klebsiella pneumoniae]